VKSQSVGNGSTSEIGADTPECAQSCCSRKGHARYMATQARPSAAWLICGGHRSDDCAMSCMLVPCNVKLADKLKSSLNPVDSQDMLWPPTLSRMQFGKTRLCIFVHLQSGDMVLQSFSCTPVVYREPYAMHGGATSPLLST
jgi:hypothetical protein